MTTFKKNSCYSCPAVYVCLDVDSDNDFDNIPGMDAIAKTMSSCFNDYNNSRQLKNAVFSPIATISKNCILHTYQDLYVFLCTLT